MRTVGEVGYCAIRRNYAVVEYDTYDAMKRAVRKLDDTKLRSGGESRYIRVYNCYRHHSSRSHSRSRSYSSSRSRSQSYSSRSRSYSSRSQSRSSSSQRHSASPSDPHSR